jgi:hypothetical protein
MPRRVRLVVPRRSDVDEIAEIVSHELGDTPRTTIWNAVDPITRPFAEMADIDWADGHDADGWEERRLRFLLDN